MDKKDNQEKMNELVNDKQTYQELKRDPTPALQIQRNRYSTLLSTTMLCTTGTKTIRSIETTQTEHTDATHSLALWISHLPTVKILDHTLLQPLTNESRHKVQSTKDFIDTMKTVQIPDDYKLVSFDVKSLSTSIPLQLALDCTETAITNSTHELPLPKDDIMDLLKLCLTCSFFQYNGKHYKQLHGMAMGSRVSAGCCGRNRHAEHRTTSHGHVQRNTATLFTLR